MIDKPVIVNLNIIIIITMQNILHTLICHVFISVNIVHCKKKNDISELAQYISLLWLHSTGSTFSAKLYICVDGSMIMRAVSVKAAGTMVTCNKVAG